MRRVRIGDVELNVEEQGRGIPLLLVHGFPLDHSMWRAQIAEFSGKFRIVAPDLRGFGRSDVTPGTVTMERFADDLAGLLDALKVGEPVVYVGLSMGGYAAWQFWKRHSQRLRAMILCDTRAAADTKETAQGRRNSAQQVIDSGPKTLVDGMVPRLFTEKTRQEQTELVETTKQVMLSAPREGIAAALRGMAERPDMAAELPKVTIPVLCICGTDDVITPAKEMRGMADSLPNAKFREIPDAGHMAPLEQPALVNAAIREFLPA